MPFKISAFLSDMKEGSCSQKPLQFFSSFLCVSVSVCLVEDVGSSCKGLPLLVIGHPTSAFVKEFVHFFSEITYSLALLLFEVFLQALRTTRTDVGSSSLKVISARKGDTGNCRTWLEECLYSSCFLSVVTLFIITEDQWKHSFPSVGQIVLGLLQSSVFSDYWNKHKHSFPLFWKHGCDPSISEF